MQNFPSEKRNRKSKKDWATNKNETKNSSKTKMKKQENDFGNAKISHTKTKRTNLAREKNQGILAK